ncbi:hypothetical protein BDV96DRAFT_651016 [Lophiotrema nucula]|uniref:Uncharacterized protein n=1 Tax=Lophiotrema nucula TaxID=690887 RepID=A0A6A5YW67_9PLEO|nr:hypothetical protein BDV96DRAFT_651016 [Lophiotrema nucula]
MENQLFPNNSLRKHRKNGIQPPRTASTKGQSPLFQNATFLPEYFSSHVDAELAAEDSFYAVARIFRFAAISESQALNLVESKIAKEANPVMLLTKTDLSLTNLLYHKQFLERHIDRIEENLRIIATRSEANWPRSKRAGSDNEISKVLSRTEKMLLDDYDYLLQRAKSLSRMCETNMQIVIQSLQVRETKGVLPASHAQLLNNIGTVFVALIENNIRTADIDVPTDNGIIIIHNATKNQTSSAVSEGVTGPPQYVERARELGYTGWVDHGSVTVGEVLEANIEGLDKRDWHSILSGTLRYELLEKAAGHIAIPWWSGWEPRKFELTW